MYQNKMDDRAMALFYCLLIGLCSYFSLPTSEFHASQQWIIIKLILFFSK